MQLLKYFTATAIGVGNIYCLKYLVVKNKS